ncbi:MAG: leucine-rich repeat domain-containing protein, partial [Firmicutes bacterium]|nr:leucine-rich repeat domain-containing protein [Bacillota bacterium]
NLKSKLKAILPVIGIFCFIAALPVTAWILSRGGTDLENSDPGGRIPVDLAVLFAAVSDTLELSALDMSMDICVSVDGSDHTENMYSRVKVIDRDAEQTAYLRIYCETRESVYYDISLYYYEECIYTEKSPYEKYIDSAGAPDFEEIQDEFLDIGIDFDGLGALNPSAYDLGGGKYEIVIEGADLNKFVADIEDLSFGFGDMTIWVWIDPETGFFSRLEYSADFAAGDIRLMMSAVIEILAFNDDVTIDVPDDVVDLIGCFQSQGENLIYLIENCEIKGLTEYGKTLARLDIPKVIDGQVVTGIGQYAFGIPMTVNNTIQSVTLPDTLIRIGDGAFVGCMSITEMTIPRSVKHIQNSMSIFFGFSYNVTVFMESDEPPEISPYPYAPPFYAKLIVVPDAALDAYRAAWAGEAICARSDI